MATSPAASAAILPQVLELQKQQTAIIASLSGGGGGAAQPLALPQQQQQQQPMVGGFNFMATSQQQSTAPAVPLGLNGLPLTRGLPAPPQPAANPPPGAPKVHDPFDFASKDLFGGL